MGRCLIATDLPQRQPRRISNFSFVQPCRPSGGILGRRHPFIACENLSLAKRHEPGSFAPREGSDVFPRHGSHHEGNHAHEVVKACPEFGNVCRVFGNR